MHGIIANIPVAITAYFTGLTAFAQSLLPTGKRRIMLYEMKRCGLINGDGQNRIFYKALRNHMNSMLKMCYLPGIDSVNVDKCLAVEGLKRIDEALEKGNGAVLLNPHFGPFMLVMPAIGHRGYKLAQVALQGEPIIGRRKGLKKGIYDKKFNAIEKKMPVNFINAAESNMALREVIRTLGRNEIVLFASTGRGGQAWHEVDFLGRRATFNLTPFRVSLKTSSEILPVFVVDSKPYAKVIIEKPLDIGRCNTPEHMLEQYVSVLESYVRKHSDHFAFFLYEMKANSWWDDHPFFNDYNEDPAIG
jgi:KDO2-lipid IV(A) lauroyltransferase